MSGPTPDAPAHFVADLARFDKIFADSDAIEALVDGSEEWHYINPDKVPARVLDAYSDLVTLGYARGWLT